MNMVVTALLRLGRWQMQMGDGGKEKIATVSSLLLDFKVLVLKFKQRDRNSQAALLY